MVSKTGTKRRFRLRWSLTTLFAFVAVCALLFGRVAYKRSQLVSSWSREQAVARRVSGLGGGVGYEELCDPNWTVFGRCENWLLEKLIGWKYFRRIRAVNLDRTNITVEDFQNLGLAKLEQLKILHLYGCKELDDGIGSHLCQLCRLRVLTLSYTSVGDDTVMKLKVLTDLEELRLQGVDTVSPKALQEVEKWPGLSLLR